ncbi:MAG: tetratricopeptide repeat protein [Nitrospira sp.]
MASPHSNAAEIDRLALALAKEPGSKAFIPLAEEYGKAGMWAEAASVLEDGLKHYPGFITAMVALGRAYDQLNQPTKAKAVLEEAIKISPENLRAHRTLAKIYATEGAKDAALRSCDVILGINPSDQESLSLRASLGAAVPAAPPKPGKAPIKSLASSTERQKPGNESPAVDSDKDIRSTEPGQTDTGRTTATAERDLSTGVPSPALPPLEQSSAATQQPEPATASSESIASRNEAKVIRLNQWLQSIQARRRDRPSGESSARISHG